MPANVKHKRQARRANGQLREIDKLGLLPVQQEFIAAMVRNRLPFSAASDLMRKAYALEAVRQCQGNKCEAARLIAVHRNTLERILEREL